MPGCLLCCANRLVPGAPRLSGIVGRGRRFMRDNLVHFQPHRFARFGDRFRIRAGRHGSGRRHRSRRGCGGRLGHNRGGRRHRPRFRNWRGHRRWRRNRRRLGDYRGRGRNGSGLGDGYGGRRRNWSWGRLGNDRSGYRCRRCYGRRRWCSDWCGHRHGCCGWLQGSNRLRLCAQIVHFFTHRLAGPGDRSGIGRGGVRNLRNRFGGGRLGRRGFLFRRHRSLG